MGETETIVNDILSRMGVNGRITIRRTDSLLGKPFEARAEWGDDRIVFGDGMTVTDACRDLLSLFQEGYV